MDAFVVGVVERAEIFIPTITLQRVLYMCVNLPYPILVVRIIFKAAGISIIKRLEYFYI